MTSAKSCKTQTIRNPERTWFVEMLRRCKVLPIIIAVAYFLSNILPVLLSYNHVEAVMGNLYGAMTGASVFNMIIGIAGGIVVSCAVFKYLHSTASVIDAHARPQTRTQLFRGSFFAGLVMTAGPVVLTGLFYLCMLGAHTSEGTLNVIDMWNQYPDLQSVFNAAHIAGWVVDNILIIGYAYCLSCLAAILAGTAAIQALLSLLLLGLAGIVYLVFEGYMSIFLFGYNGHEDVSGYLSPYVYLLTRDAFPFTTNPGILLLHVGIAVLAVIAAALIYKRIRLENEERTIAIHAVADVLVVLLSVLSVSVVMFIIETLTDVDATAGAVISVILATVVFFPVYCMISEQSFRIFNRRNGKSFIAYAIAMCLILAFTLFDVSGFEKRVPAAGEVQSIDIEDGNLTNTQFRGIKDRELIALVTELHESIVQDQEKADAKDKALQKGGEPSDSIGGIQITYKLKNGRTMTRRYDEIDARSFAEYAAYYDSKLTREQECLDPAHPVRKDEYLCISDAKAEGVFAEGSYDVPEDKVEGLVKAINQDVMQWTAQNQELFIYHDEPEEYHETYVVAANIDYRVVEDRDNAYNRTMLYIVLGDEDTHANKYITENKLITKKNLIGPDDPRLEENTDPSLEENSLD